MSYPNFIIIGAMKTGTSVTWHNLNKHPEIQMIKNPEDPKPASLEIRFWNDGQPYHTFTNKGIEWYKSLFKYPNKIQGEKCANYIEGKSSIKRIHTYIPNVKLIICIRNPSNRAFSEFSMQCPTGTLTMEIALKKGYLKRGEYYKQIINNVLPFFPKEQLYIVIQERMKNDTNGELNKLYKFIGANPFELDIQKVTAKEATDRNLDLKKDSQINKYKVWESKYKIESKLKKQFDKYFKEHNKKLFEFLGYEIGEWK